MSNIFKNYELSFKYPNNWKLLEADDIENCIAVLDCDSKFSRVMVFKYPQEGLSMEYLKNAIEDIPREDSNDRDAYSFNFFGFGEDNPDKEGFMMMYRTLEFL